MDLINNLAQGFGVALTFQNIGLCFIGCMIGTLIGVLPGVGPSPPSPCCCRSLSVCRRSAR